MEKRWRRLISGIGDGVIGLLFPHAANCLCCGDPRRAGENCLCENCERALDKLKVPPESCHRCLSPVPKGKKCPFCASPVMKEIERVFSPWRYAGAVRQLIHAFKFNACDEALPLLADAMDGAVTAREYDCITPVPLHEKRLRQRGVNQSLLLCRELGERLHLPVRELLRRDTYHGPQSRLPMEKRRANVAGAFSCQGEAKGLRVLLVDDVRTSGSTAHSCAQALREAGAESVCLCTAAVVYRKTGRQSP